MKRFLLASCCAALASCASSAGPVKTYDLGLDAPKSALPALRSVSVRAAMPFDGIDMYYRLAWRDGAEIAPFAQSRWAAPPADLLRKQVLRALPSSSAAPCALELEMQDFSQVFSAKESSEARLELRALLGTTAGRVASRSVLVSEANAGVNAASGAAALSRAVGRAIAELGGWIAAQPGCKG